MSPYSSALIIAGFIFGLVSLTHLLRVIYKVPIIIGNKIIPMWASILSFILTLLLSIYMFIVSPPAHSQLVRENMKLHSSVFNTGHSIPAKYTCQGDNISPPLSWQDAPNNTKSFVLIVDDPDAPNGTWDHWIIYNIPGSMHELPENISDLPPGTHYGKNSWGKTNYGGPCPPAGEHRYYFKLYALDTLLKLVSGVSKPQLEIAMKGHVIDTAILMGLFKK